MLFQVLHLQARAQLRRADPTRHLDVAEAVHAHRGLASFLESAHQHLVRNHALQRTLHPAEKLGTGVHAQRHVDVEEKRLAFGVVEPGPAFVGGRLDQHVDLVREVPGPELARFEAATAEVGRALDEVREISHGVAILSKQQPEKAVWSRVVGDTLDLAMLGKALQPRGIGHKMQVFVDQRSDQPPELVLRMRVIALRGEARFARQAAEHQHQRRSGTDWVHRFLGEVHWFGL